MQTNTTAFKLNSPRDLPITRESVKAQDLSYLDGRLTALKKRMKGHPGKNRDWDSESKSIQLAEVDHPEFDPTTSRQVRRQIERRTKKFSRTHKFGKGIVKYGQRVQRSIVEATGTIVHKIVDTDMIVLTHVSTTRYTGHIGKNQTASLGGYGDVDFVGK